MIADGLEEKVSCLEHSGSLLPTQIKHLRPLLHCTSRLHVMTVLVGSKPTIPQSPSYDMREFCFRKPPSGLEGGLTHFRAHQWHLPLSRHLLTLPLLKSSCKRQYSAT